MPRKHINAALRFEFGTGPGAQAPFAYFPPPLGRPKISLEGGVSAPSRTRRGRRGGNR